jgi:hypothetical protein
MLITARALSKHLWQGKKSAFDVRNLKGKSVILDTHMRELDDTWLGLAYTKEKIVATLSIATEKRRLKAPT